MAKQPLSGQLVYIIYHFKLADATLNKLQSVLIIFKIGETRVLWVNSLA